MSYWSFAENRWSAVHKFERVALVYEYRKPRHPLEQHTITELAPIWTKLLLKTKRQTKSLEFTQHFFFVLPLYALELFILFFAMFFRPLHWSLKFSYTIFFPYSCRPPIPSEKLRTNALEQENEALLGVFKNRLTTFKQTSIIKK